LRERSHTKAASALKRAVNGIITIDDTVVHEGPTLQKILQEWRELKAAADAMYAQCLYPFFPYLSHSRDASSSDSDSGEYTEPKFMSI
jgi:hypothetical protein